MLGKREDVMMMSASIIYIVGAPVNTYSLTNLDGMPSAGRDAGGRSIDHSSMQSPSSPTTTMHQKPCQLSFSYHRAW